MIDYAALPSPCFVLDERRLRSNLELMKSVQERAGVTIILALKGFAMWSTFPLVRQYLKACTASSLHEALLCVEEFGEKAHTYAPAYVPGEMEALLRSSSHLSFNSLSQYEYFKPLIAKAPHRPSLGLRVNPEHSDVGTALYNPCSPGSRLGISAEHLKGALPDGIEGLHFHALCESNSYSLQATLEAFEAKFGRFFDQIKWVNMGGGHLMTNDGYDVDHLVDLLTSFRKKHGVEVILEPGSAVAWRTGELKSTVLDVVTNRGVTTAILDVSFTAHMPDTLEMPYRPVVRGATDPQPGKFTCQLGGLSCLSGDFMTAYSFDAPLKAGDTLIFEDMMHYTMVKTTTFNGVQHPCIAIWNEDGTARIIRTFEYLDFKNRLS
ncbi:MAG: carboxynorspermidine decarboxylase [Saprospiraceae bacterium]